MSGAVSSLRPRCRQGGAMLALSSCMKEPAVEWSEQVLGCAKCSKIVILDTSI